MVKRNFSINITIFILKKSFLNNYNNINFLCLIILMAINYFILYDYL